MLVETLMKMWKYHSYDLDIVRLQDNYGKSLLEDAIRLAKQQELQLKDCENRLCNCGKSNSVT